MKTAKLEENLGFCLCFPKQAYSRVYRNTGVMADPPIFKRKKILRKTYPLFRRGSRYRFTTPGKC